MSDIRFSLGAVVADSIKNDWTVPVLGWTAPFASSS